MRGKCLSRPFTLFPYFLITIVRKLLYSLHLHFSCVRFHLNCSGKYFRIRPVLEIFIIVNTWYFYVLVPCTYGIGIINITIMVFIVTCFRIRLEKSQLLLLLVCIYNLFSSGGVFMSSFIQILWWLKIIPILYLMEPFYMSIQIPFV